MIKIKDRVKLMLTKYPDLREDDNLLIANIFVEEIGGTAKAQQLSAFDFLKHLSTGSFSNFESIRRVRQKLQEDYPELRGKNYDNRKKGGDEISNQIKDL